MDIPEAIRKMVNGDRINPALGIICTVVSVDAPTCVCSPINGDADIEDVRLKAGDGDGILMIPVVNSVVIVHMVNDVEGYVSMFSDVESIQLLDGSFGGLIKIADLVTKLNNVENKVNSIITALTTLTLPVSGSTAGPPASPPVVGNLTPTTQNDIKNDKITHGQ